MTIIIGIDPGSRITGYGIISHLNKKLNWIDSGFIKTNKPDLPSRLKLIYSELNKIIKKFRPKIFAIEQIFIAKNADSALKLGQAKGAAIVAAVNNNLPVFEYAARKVKQIIVGTGNAEKKQVQSMVCKILKLVITLQPDAADALAIAITHYFLTRNN